MTRWLSGNTLACHTEDHPFKSYFFVEFEFSECSENHFGKTQLLLQMYMTDLKLFLTIVSGDNVSGS